MNKGFTLIELLVVVLIIGILAAIALPQYTKAVERSRTAEAVQWLGDVVTAQQIYYMQNNQFADGLNAESGVQRPLNDGDITVPAPSARWNQGAWSISTSGVLSFGLERKDGMYLGGVLTVTISPSGQVTKTCTTDAGGFCDIAKGMGFKSYLENL